MSLGDCVSEWSMSEFRVRELAQLEPVERRGSLQMYTSPPEFWELWSNQIEFLSLEYGDTI
jgi:hypothetical protein